ncbi:hypothetical protein ACQP3D_29345, partial [Escherichia coli]
MFKFPLTFMPVMLQNSYMVKAEVMTGPRPLMHAFPHGFLLAPPLLFSCCFLFVCYLYCSKMMYASLTDALPTPDH